MRRERLRISESCGRLPKVKSAAVPESSFKNPVMAIVFRCETCGQRYRVGLDKAGVLARCRQCGSALVVPGSTHMPAGVERPVRRATLRPDVIPTDEAHAGAIIEHVEQHVGRIDYIFRELVSEIVRIDVLRIPPTKQRPFYTLVTSGMSDKAMTVTEGGVELQFAELMICLPAEWPVAMDDFRDEKNYWPIRLLKVLARLPHEYDTWLSLSHTIPNGDPPHPYAENTGFCCALIVPPLTCSDEFRTLRLFESAGEYDEETEEVEKCINFYAVLPLYRDEMDCKLHRGMDRLIDQLDRTRVTELLDLRRKSSCPRGLWGLW